MTRTFRYCALVSSHSVAVKETCYCCTVIHQDAEPQTERFMGSSQSRGLDSGHRQNNSRVGSFSAVFK